MAQRMNPFPGLRPFEMQEKYLFFGREDQTVELLKRLGQARFMAVVGTSGSGKSSLVRAGLLPELHGGTMTEAGSSWEIAVMRPGGDPLTNLARSLEDSGIYDTDEEGYYRHLRAMLGRSTMGLIEAVSQSTLEKEDNLLIVVDQFEEIFRFRSSSGKHAEEAANFISLLLEATQQTSKSIFVTITMRSDFLGDCSQFRGLAEAVNEGEYLIPRLNRNQRRLAIEGPVKVGGKQIEARLVQQLLNDIGDDPDQLPILQHALMRTWEYHEKAGGEGALDLDDYEATGGMKEALSRHADEVYEELQSEEERIYCERIFKALTERVSGGRGIRRPMALSELAEVVGADDPNKLIPVIEAYRAAGRTFLMPPDSIALGPKIVIDISHESLMRVWQHLVGWVDEEAQSARIYRRLADTAQLYRENKAGLYRDPDLQISLSWRDQNNPTEAWADRYYPGYKDAMAFLEESHETAIAEEKAKEEARIRELEQARRLAEEERRSKSLWQKLVCTFGIAVIAITFFLFYISESRDTIRDNLSLVNLKEANRLANNYQEDQAISLLAKTVENNPDYKAASIRLMSVIENTALPANINKIYSPDKNIKLSNLSIKLYAEHNVFINRCIIGEKTRIQLNSLINGDVIYEETSSDWLSNGIVSKNGKYFIYQARDKLANNSIIKFFNIKSNEFFQTGTFEDVRNIQVSSDGDKLLIYHQPIFLFNSNNNNRTFTIFSLDKKEVVYEYNHDSSDGFFPLNLSLVSNDNNICMSSDGGNISMVLIRNETIKIVLCDYKNKNIKTLKHYNINPKNCQIRYTEDNKSIIVSLAGTRAGVQGVTLSEIISLDTSKSLNLRGSLVGRVVSKTLKNDEIIVSTTPDGGMTMSRYPYGNFISMFGHNDFISSLALSFDGVTLASASADRTVRLWDVMNGSQISSPIRFNEGVTDVGFSTNGEFIHVALASGDIYKIKLPLRKSHQISFDYASTVSGAINYNSDADVFMHISENDLNVLDLNDSKNSSINDIENVLNVGNYFPHKFYPNLNEVKYLSVNQKTNIYIKSINYKSKSLSKILKLPSGTYAGVFDENGKYLAILLEGRRVSVIDIKEKNTICDDFDLGRGQWLATPIVGEGLVFGFGLSGQFYDLNNGSRIGGMVDISNPRLHYFTSKRISFIHGRSSMISFVKGKASKIINFDLGQRYSSHGVNNNESLLAVANEAGEVALFDLNNGARIGGVLNHNKEVVGVVFHPENDQYIFTLIDGGFVYGWDRIDGNIFMGPVKLSQGHNIFINKEGNMLTVPSLDNRLYRIPVYLPLININYSSWLPNLANAIIGFKENNIGEYTYSGWSESKNTILDSKIDIRNNFVKEWVNWVTSEEAVTKISPRSEVTIHQFIESLYNSNNPSDLIKALRLSPSNPDILSKFAYVLFEKFGVGDEYIKPVQFAISRARILGENNSLVFYRSAQIEKILNNKDNALKYINRAIELDSKNTVYSDLKKTLLQNN